MQRQCNENPAKILKNCLKGIFGIKRGFRHGSPIVGISSMPWSVEKTPPQKYPQPGRSAPAFTPAKAPVFTPAKAPAFTPPFAPPHGPAWTPAFFVRTGKTLFFVPSLASESRNARRPSKDGRVSGHREAARSRAQPKGRARRASLMAEHMKGKSQTLRASKGHRRGLRQPRPKTCGMGWRAVCSAESTCHLAGEGPWVLTVAAETERARARQIEELKKAQKSKYTLRPPGDRALGEV